MKRRETILAVLALQGLFWAHFLPVRSTNFGGFDEWFLQWATQKGIWTAPHANRPFNFFWTVAAAGLGSQGLGRYYLAHGLYLSLSGLALFALLRRLRPGEPQLAYLAAAFSLVWVPLDMARLSTVQMAFNSGFLMSALTTLLLLVESWHRGSRLLLVLACAAAVFTLRGYEAETGLIAGAPLLLLAMPRRRDRSLAIWVGVFALSVVVAIALVAVPLLQGTAKYQTSAWGLDLHPLGVARRLAHQYGLHLGPLIAASPGPLGHPAVLLATAVFLAGLWLLRTAQSTTPGFPVWLALMGWGLGFAALGYGPFLASPGLDSPHRVQLQGAPGVGVFLAAVACALSQALAARWRTLGLGALGAFAIASGSARTVTLQRQWDHASYYPSQARTMDELKQLAPTLVPDTLVLLIDQTGAWPASFSFRFALQLTFGDQVAGVVVGASDPLFQTSLTDQGVRVEPLPEIQRPWGITPRLYPQDNLLVVRRTPSGLRLETAWPSELGSPLRRGSYRPWTRIVGPGGSQAE